MEFPLVSLEKIQLVTITVVIGHVLLWWIGTEAEYFCSLHVEPHLSYVVRDWGSVTVSFNCKHSTKISISRR